MDTGLPEWLQPFEPEETDADGDPIGTGPEAGQGKTRLLRVKRPQLNRLQAMPKELWQFAWSTRVVRPKVCHR